MEEFLTTKEIARLLKIHVITVRRWITSGKLRATFLGKEYRIKESDLDKFLKQREVKRRNQKL